MRRSLKKLNCVATDTNRKIIHAHLVHIDKKEGPQTKNLRAFFAPETGGGSGIRTHGDVAATTVFKTVAFVHSAIPPYGGQPGHYRHENAV